MIKKITFFLFSVVLLSCSSRQDPNFVFILVDDLGWADVKCNFPESFYETPHIDQLGASGVRFTHAYSANPVCSPSRAAIMTGKHPNRVNITDWIPGLDPKDRLLLGPEDSDHLGLEEVTIAEKLKEKGYKTCHVGKWHLGDVGFFPEDQGFDINIGGNHTGSPKGGYYSPYHNPQLVDGSKGEYLTDRLTDEGIKFISENKREPFFLYLSFYSVHTPIQASKRFIARAEARRDLLGPDKDLYVPEGDGYTRRVQGNAAYASMVAAMDENVGRVLKAIREEGLEDNTWVIFVSDNGGLSTKERPVGPTSNGPLRAGKGWCYEGGLRVPLIVAGPGVKQAGRIEDTPVIGMDFFPTILSLAGISYSQNDGVSLLPVLLNQGSLDRKVLFWHYPHYHGSTWKPGSAILKDNWKLIVDYESHLTQLYNLERDPGETHDLSENNPDKVAELKEILEQKLTDSHAQFPILNPNYAGKQE